MIFKNENNRLKEIQVNDFKLEKELQTLTENNLKELFGLEFIASEFSIENYRFDTVAFDKESNSFIIIEYKRGQNKSLVDQGVTYLYTLLDRKADFVLLYQKKTNEKKEVKDFDWTQTRIIFISQEFTEFQKSASSFVGQAFILYEIKRYSEGIISVEKINPDLKNQIGSPKVNVFDNEKTKLINKEIKVYTEEDHLNKSTESISELYEILRQEILSLSGVKIDVKKIYVAFKGIRNIVDIMFFKNRLDIIINMRKGELNDPLKLTSDVSNIGHNGNGDYRLSLDSVDLIEEVMFLIRQSWKKNK